MFLCLVFSFLGLGWKVQFYPILHYTLAQYVMFVILHYIYGLAACFQPKHVIISTVFKGVVN